ncbi:MAG TPA: TlpA disulfide reductase family protein [Acidimicrobiales bacterium]|nr:TlpA disulfide reductase family protein [Acidimicrobiales bacterium]
MSGGPTAGIVAPAPVRRRRVVMWSAICVAVAVAVLIAVIASAQPSSEVSAKSPLLGNTAPAISGRGLEGGHYTLSQFHGRWVLVNFMATWCTACQKEMPQLERFWDEHSKRGDAVVLTVADDPTNLAQLRSFLISKGAHWPAVDDPAATVSYGLQGLPTSFLVAPDGVVYWYLLGEVQASQLDKLLQQGASLGLGQA